MIRQPMPCETLDRQRIFKSLLENCLPIAHRLQDNPECQRVHRSFGLLTYRTFGLFQTGRLGKSLKMRRSLVYSFWVFNNSGCLWLFHR